MENVRSKAPDWVVGGEGTSDKGVEVHMLLRNPLVSASAPLLVDKASKPAVLGGVAGKTKGG